MNKETVSYIILGLLVSVLSVVARERINKDDVNTFINNAKGISEILKLITEPFCKKGEIEN